jgi:hypothetical protein
MGTIDELFMELVYLEGIKGMLKVIAVAASNGSM